MANNIDAPEVKLKAKDFASDQDVRWCPGCGDYSILAQVQRSFPDIGVKKEQLAWVSGIGCSVLPSRPRGRARRDSSSWRYPEARR